VFLSALKQYDLDAVRLLLKKGVDPNIELKSENITRLKTVFLIDHDKGRKHRTALVVAVYVGNCDIARLLLESGAEPNSRGEDAHWHSETGFDVNLQGGKYDTALQAASAKENIEMVQLLLEWGADPNIEGKRAT
jgi:hypothetical protein